MNRQIGSAALAVAIVGLLGLAGCSRQKLDKTVTMTVKMGEYPGQIIDAPRTAQKVSVVVTPSGTPVDVCVVPANDKDAAEQAMLANKKPATAFAFKAKIDKEDTIEAEIPAKTEFMVMLGNTKKTTEVKLKITGK